MEKHFDDIKKELFNRVELHALKAHLEGGDIDTKVEYAELSCLYAFDAFLKVLKQR